MGRMKYRAARRRWRVRSDGATATALCPITSGCWRDDGATATAGLLPLPVAGEAGQRLLELGEAFLGLALSGERLVHGIPELAGHLVVFASRHARGPRHGVGESAEQLSDEGILRQDVLVLVERGDGRVEADLDGCALLLLGAGQVLGQVDRRLGVLRVLVHRPVPAAQRAGVLAVRSALRQGAHAHLPLRRAVRRLGERPRVRPVAHEHRVAGLEGAARLLLRVVQHALGRDALDPRARELDRRHRLRVVDGDLALSVDDGSAAEAVHPLQPVAREPLVGTALEDDPPQLLVARLALSVLDDLRRLGQVLPGRGGLPPVLLEQVLAVVEEPGVGEGRQRHQLPADGIRLDDGRKVLGDDVLRDFLAQIHQVLGQEARPDDVDPDDVDLARLLRKELLEERELLVGVLGDGDDLHLVAGLLRPRLRAGLAEIELGADGTASNRDGALRGSGTGGKDRADANEGERGGEQDGETRSDCHGTSSRIPTSVSCGGETGEYQKRANRAKAPAICGAVQRVIRPRGTDRTVRRPSVSAQMAVLAPPGHRAAKEAGLRGDHGDLPAPFPSRGRAGSSWNELRISAWARYLSMITATTMMSPVTICRAKSPMPSRSKPLLRTPMIEAPRSVPIIEPFPPLMLVPPMTTAAMALSSKPTPRMGLAMLSRIMYMIAASPTMPPHKVKAATL